MKFAIPEISWHNRDPVLSVDFQPKAESNEPLRLATGGTDSHVLIWYLSTTDSGSVNLEVAADLTRHQKAVNVVRWSPNGKFLASGDDESIIFIWKKTDKEPAPVLDQIEEQYKESWVIHKTLRGHMEDVLDISWSPNSLHLASGSVDNKLLVWDLTRGKYSCILSDHKGFVQGVSWDPKGQMIATVSTDRVFRTFDVATKKVISRNSKAILPFPADHPLHDTKVRLYHDDTLQTYFRRLEFSPDGLLIAVPAGKIEPEQGKVDIEPTNAVYIYTRYCLKAPACVLPCGSPALACRWAARGLAARGGGPAGPFPARHVLAVGTKHSVLVYDTQQKTPIAIVSNIHYTRLTDLTWSPDGCTLVASSTDGYCSVITFAKGELGEVLPDDEPKGPAPATEPMEIDEQPETPKEEKTPEGKSKQKDPQTTTAKEQKVKPVNKIDISTKFKAPGEKSPKKQKVEPQQKTPVKIDVLEEMAMPSWSDNSSNEMIRPKDTRKDSEIMVIEDSEDIKLVYEETQDKSASQSPKSPKTNNTKDQTVPKTMEAKPTVQAVTPKVSQTTLESNNFLRRAKVTDAKEPASGGGGTSPKAPRRVAFVTLSSPKNAKKK
ncbi:unnamed protein product [Arctia plantaginis]|uniref:CAF1B/HIR1 beta-propeller domain-containing protein n=1 Tax=Arctia plantaginis TaxID=874455 RepID=A0A8S0ZXB4_ARCPL|nr:unnamed protein product [Arctia plantaginis]